MKRWKSLNSTQRRTVAVTSALFLLLTATVSPATKAHTSFSCVNALTGTHGVISSDANGDTARSIAIKNCKGDIAAATKSLQDIYGDAQIMHGAIVQLP